MGRLSSVVQAVEFEIEVAGVGAKRCLISSELLQERFGAHGDPASWLLAYERCQTEIHEAARATWRASTVIVILTEESFEVAP